MSVHCRVLNASLLLRVLQTVAIAKDTWATCVFTRDVLILHTAGDDQASTASATIPKSLFYEYAAVGDPRFMVHVASLVDALLMRGGGLLQSAASKMVLAYPTGDGRLLVELEDNHRTIQSTLTTRPVKERLLDLRFSDALVVNRITLRGEALVEYLNDVQAFQATSVRLAFSPTHLRLIGLQSVLGHAEISVGKNSDAVLGFDVGDTTLSPKFFTHHLLKACGMGLVRSGLGIASRGALAAGGGGSSFDALGGDALGSGFERLTLVINAERQLCVMHQGLDHSLPALVNIVISSTCELEEL